MKSLTPPGASSDATLVPEEEFFAARTYSGWVRGSLRAVAARRDAAILFGSSISEPTDELIHVVRSAFSPRLTSRYISVFSDGNRYVVDAICARYGVKPENVVTSTGVTGALSMLVKAFVAAGDRVLVEPRIRSLGADRARRGRHRRLCGTHAAAIQIRPGSDQEASLSGHPADDDHESA